MKIAKGLWYILQIWICLLFVVQLVCFNHLNYSRELKVLLERRYNILETDVLQAQECRIYQKRAIRMSDNITDIANIAISVRYNVKLSKFYLQTNSIS